MLPLGLKYTGINSTSKSNGWVVEFDENTRKATFRFFTPDNISQDTFNIWLDQSVNKACIHIFDKTFQEL